VLSEIKEQLLEQPDAIIEILDYFDFAHITPSSREIRFARDHKGGKNISIRLERNECLYVSDWARAVSADIFSYIIQEKGVTFREVIQKTKQVLNLSDDWRPKPKHQLFGGIYSNVTCSNKEIRLKTYDEDMLDQYEACGNLRFLRDGISLEAQRFWGIRFSIECNSIIIPMRNEYGDLVGYKLTDLTYCNSGNANTQELIGKAGETLTSVLDKIKNMLVNFEYFYDINGKFVFQKMDN
jgi:hypothetical protein